ncbi:MAG TPA: hypothetical protein VFP25_01865 [Nitrososphaeraceae archaeon]|nr:hypothetical protein [Nitrososphaeraceae archaeon]
MILSHNIDTSAEHPDTYHARKILKEIFRKQFYEIEEEVPMDTVTNNIGETIWPPYRADMLLCKQFIIELDPQSAKKYKSKGHGTKRRRIHDKWKDTNIKKQMKISIVRLIPQDIITYREQGKDGDILEEINYQLKEKEDVVTE